MIVELLLSQSLLADGLSLASKAPECKWDASLEMSRLMTVDRKNNQRFDYGPWEQNLLLLADAYLKAGCIDQAETTFSNVMSLTRSARTREKARAGLDRTLARLPPAGARQGKPVRP
jgi:hypothetical protein